MDEGAGAGGARAPGPGGGRLDCCRNIENDASVIQSNHHRSAPVAPRGVLPTEAAQCVIGYGCPKLASGASCSLPQSESLANTDRAASPRTADKGRDRGAPLREGMRVAC